MGWFGRKQAPGETPARGSSPPPPPGRTPAGRVEVDIPLFPPPPSEIMFRSGASVFTPKTGEVLIGRVEAGILRPGASLRLWLTRTGEFHPTPVQVVRIEQSRHLTYVWTHSTPLTEEVESAGPGPEVLTVTVAGVADGVVRKGDYLLGPAP